MLALLVLLSLAGASVREHGAPASPFVENRGQWPAHVAFVARARGAEHALVLRAEQGALGIEVTDWAADRRAVARLEFVGGEAWTPIGRGERSERHHAYVGNDPAAWIRGVRAFERIVYRDEQAAERVEVLLGPEGPQLRALGGAMPAVRWRGDDALVAVGAQGRVRTAGGGAEHVVIDLGLAWSTYLGGALGNAEQLEDIRVPTMFPTRAFVAGHSNADDFPVTPGVYSAPHVGYRATVTCFDVPSGALLWSATLGGEKIDRAFGVDVDATGAVYLAGETTSKTFPVTPGAHQTVYDDITVRAFCAKLSADATDLMYATYLGGPGPLTGGTTLEHMRVRPGGSAVLVGTTSTEQFPTTPGSFQPTPVSTVDAYVVVLTPDGTGLEWSTRLGSTASDFASSVALEPDGAVTVAGRTGAAASFPKTPGGFQWNVPVTVGSGVRALFVVRFEPDGSALRWSALSGWPTAQDPAMHLVTGADGRAVLAGQTWGTPIPVTAQAFQPHYGGNRDGFVLVFSGDGSSLLAGSYVGGEWDEALSSVAIDDSGVITAGGWAIPPTPWLTEPIVTPTGPVIGAAALYRFTPDLSAVLSAHVFGGAQGLKANSLSAIAVLPQGDVIAAGTTLTPDFPTTPGAFQPDAPGGQWDGVVVRHRMLPAGVHRNGRSGPACASHGYLAASGPSQAGNAGFTLYSSNVPPSSTGWLALGFPSADPIVFGGGLTLHVDPRAPHLLLPWDANGTGHTALTFALPAQAAGLELAAQLVLLAPECPDGLAWTHALRMTVAP